MQDAEILARALDELEEAIESHRGTAEQRLNAVHAIINKRTVVAAMVRTLDGTQLKEY